MPNFLDKNVTKLILFCGLTWTIMQASLVLAADVTAPTTNFTINPSSPDGTNGWYITPVQITLSATDLESGVQSINYKVDSGSWQQINFANTLNLAPNPSFEQIDTSNNPPIKDWVSSIQDANTTYNRDTSNSVTGYETTSATFTTTASGWHGFNNQLSFSAAAPLSNMSASVYVKTDNLTGNAFFNVYAVLENGSSTYLATSNIVTGTVDWTKLSVDFIVNSPQAVGVYLDIGAEGAGTVWLDAVSIVNSTTTSQVNFTVGTDGEHTVEYYAVDNSSNIEAHSCTGNIINCESFKIDQTPPGNWHNAGAIRGLFGSDHELYVYTEVDDPTSGLSIFTDKFQYYTERNPEFGTYSNLLNCSSTWEPDTWKILISPPFEDGAKTAYLITPKTDFCNNNWKICKVVRFYAEDKAGNSTQKDFCINGPWVGFTGGGIVRANGGIDMVAEADDYNTDGLIESGNGIISFFSSSRNWKVTPSPEPELMTYDDWLAEVTPAPTTITALNTQSGVFRFNSNLEIRSQNTPNAYNSATFNQIVFINGDLKITDNISVNNGSTALFIVNGKVEIDKKVTTVGIAIFADDDFYSAYNITEGETSNTLEFAGIYNANKFHFQRTLQGTNNNNNPSENFTFEPKYSIRLGSYLGKNAIKWINSN